VSSFEAHSVMTW